MNEQKIINTIRALGIDMIAEAKSGHPGIVLGAAPILYTLYAKHMNVNPEDEQWINRDRFVLSAGHASALLYATLYMAGFNITLDDLKNFRRIDSNTPGHPELGVTSGVEVSTGPLGQGLATSVGLAMGEKFLASQFNLGKSKLFNNGIKLFNNFTYVLCSDGDLMEGISYEASSLAGTLGLGNLIVLYDSNNICLDGDTKSTFTESVLNRFSAMGWHTQLVDDGADIIKIDKAISNAKKNTTKPSIIEIKTIIGFGSKNQNTNLVHGTPLEEEDLDKIKSKLGLRNIPFVVSKEVDEDFKKLFNNRINKVYNDWQELYKIYCEQATAENKDLINLYMNQNYTINISRLVDKYRFRAKESGRDTNEKIMNIISDNLPFMMGGSADLASSTKTFLKDGKVFSKNSYEGKNIRFGVREHSMGAIANGLALCNLRPFASTFLAFSDYLKPAMRMTSLMNLPVTYIFTHDSIEIGQDGPTHQPVEQLAMLRSMPNLYVYRPADGKEIAGCWKNILKDKKPSALVISRNDLLLQKDTEIDEVGKGAYIIKKEKKRTNGIIIATGSDVQTALAVSDILSLKDFDLRVISMPCMEKYLEQPKQYKEKLMPIGVKIFVIESATSFGWHQFVYNDKYLININEFGKSGKPKEVVDAMHFSIDGIATQIENILR